MAPCSELDQAHAGRASPSPPSGNCSSGRGPGRGGGKLFLFLSLLLLPPRISWDEPSENIGTHMPGISQPFPYPCRLSSPCVCPHHDSLQPPSIPLALPWPHLSLEQLEKGEIRAAKTHSLLPPSPKIFPFLPALIQRKESAGFQASTRLCLAQLLRADDSGKSGRIRSPGSVPGWLRSPRHGFTNNGAGLERADTGPQLPPQPPAGSQEREGSEGADPALIPTPRASPDTAGH